MTVYVTVKNKKTEEERTLKCISSSKDVAIKSVKRFYDAKYGKDNYEIVDISIL